VRVIKQHQPGSLWTASQRASFRRRPPTAPDRGWSCALVLQQASPRGSALSPTKTTTTMTTTVTSAMSMMTQPPARGDACTSTPTIVSPPHAAQQPGPSTAFRLLSATGAHRQSFRNHRDHVIIVVCYTDKYTLQHYDFCRLWTMPLQWSTRDTVIKWRICGERTQLKTP